MKQNNISRLESPDYGKYSLASLKRIADALDVALVVRFVPFSQYVDWLSGTPFLDHGLSPAALAVPSFEAEEKKGVFDSEVTYWPMIRGGKPVAQKNLWARIERGEFGVQTMHIDNSRHIEEFKRERAS